MRKFKKFAATMLVGLMATTALAGCSKSNNAASGNTDGKEGSVLNIYVWNEEFKSRVTDHYPGYVKTDDSTGKIQHLMRTMHTRTILMKHFLSRRMQLLMIKLIYSL